MDNAFYKMEITNQQMQFYDKKLSFSGSTLKIIAIISMIIDHFSVIILGNIAPIDFWGVSLQRISSLIGFNKFIFILYWTMRVIGRISFPIFAFLLVEGFRHTRNVKKYALRLGIFALISEIPYDLALFNSLFYIKNQNVFFLLFISLLVISGIEYINKNFRGVIALLFKLGLILAGMSFATVLSVNYKYIGILTIVLIYFIINKGKVISTSIGCLFLSVTMKFEIFSFISLIPIKFYNGKKGLDIKYLFYILYPAHLLLLYIIANIFL